MAEDVVAQAPAGRLRGCRDGQALRFLGIPYAQSPQIAGRFAAPVPHPGWDGVRDALSYGASSPQPERGVTVIPEPLIAGDNELNLNIFTPDLGAAGLPVLVWIHGGGFAAGCSSSPWYRGQGFARDGVVLVTINYRLGAPGFLQVPDAPVNRGVRDWVRALQWVHENIAAFGGDPAKVTVAGQSAGGGACAALPGVPAAAGLFRGLICMSGGPAMLQTPDGVAAVAGQVREHLGVPLSQAALEELSTETILTAQAAVASRPADPQSPDSVRRALEGIKLQWAPWVDGEVVAADPWQTARSGAYNAIPMLTGATANEVNPSWMAADWVTGEMVRASLAKVGVPEPQLDRYLNKYAGLPPGELVGQAVGDRTFRAEAQELAAVKAAAGGRLTSMTSGGGRRPINTAACPFTHWRSRSCSTRWARPGSPKPPGPPRRRTWPPACIAPGSGSSLTASRAGAGMRPASVPSWCSRPLPKYSPTRSGRSGRRGQTRSRQDSERVRSAFVEVSGAS